MTLSQMQYYKEIQGYSYRELSELSGVPLGTVQKIFGGQTKQPRHETLQALERVLIPKEQEKDTQFTNCLREDFVYGTEAEQISIGKTIKKSGISTIEDYYSMPDESVAELIDGQFFNMSAPTIKHQLITSKIFYQIARYIDEKKGKCTVFMAPVDVQLDNDDYTMVEPDVFVVCDESKWKHNKRCVAGSPDFIIEVLSPSTKTKDMTIKLTKYCMAGVREYWLVDPDQQKIITYHFTIDDGSKYNDPLQDKQIVSFPEIYTFEDKVPVWIYAGELEIDFKLMKEI